ncbi:DUF7671 family protein [Furfurilactobacillus siliginis]|uniref:DUF7671 domain-containing protein n=1 Tax=Furfurilactobacillus siliginis TaxID=348151 RepID=A0A0R2L5X5_9LACO|nr:hypothetical protein [Furfurilactobacillus siliginis]KRN97167.1 hypothetical protein IV55_GL000086 [Furfurilactobacillus siliginis]GEK29680.1 hypothetical protein LSI01_19910 [Furfurilactobacillus siliginis]
MKGKYDVQRFVGVPVHANASGQYEASGDGKPHVWRIGKHTKGKFTGAGQIFLTENNLMVAVLAAYPVAFKDRHEWTPMQRFTSERISDELLENLSVVNQVE